MTVHRAVRRNRLNMSSLTALIAFIVALGLAGFPVLANDFVSMNDVYNHVARAAVLAHYNDTPSFKEYWLPNWRLVPYLGYDIAEVGLLSWFSMGVVVKIMIAATFASLLSGAMLLSRVAHGAWSAVTLTCALLLLNRTLLAGFINYLSGVGVSLMGAAAWMALRERASPPVRLAAFAVVATATCAVHLFAGGVLGVMVVGIELAVLFERRASLRQCLMDLALPALAFLPAFLLWVFVAPHPNYNTLVVYRSLASRLGAFAVPLTYAPVGEAVGFLVVAVAIAAFWFTGRVSVDRRLAAAAGLLFLVQLAMPADIGTATVADHRIPIAFWMVVLCAVQIHVEKRSVATGFALLVGLVLLSRVGVVQARWAKEDVLYRNAHQALASLPSTARVGTAFSWAGLSSVTRPDTALYYMPTLTAVPGGGFTQILFAISDQHALVMRPRFQLLSEATPPDALWQTFVTPSEQAGKPALQARMLAAVKDYDYLAFLQAEPFELAPTPLLEPVRDAPGVRIYRVLHEAAQGNGVATVMRPGAATDAAKNHP